MNLKNFPTGLKKAYNTPMDMKKKLDDTYLPDKESRKKRLVVGLSGGINGLVTAYLLKLQKYDLIGVTVVVGWEDYQGNNDEVMSCHLNPTRLEAIREFCHQLGIPHFVVKASEEFKEEVVERWMASRVTGTKSHACWNCHDLRMKLLYQKMVSLDAQGLATGHLAKLFRQESHETVYVHTSNDEQHDQSSLLARLPHEILDKLMLPLSDLQQKEILKLAENFGLIAESKNLKIHECFRPSLNYDTFLESHIPKKYNKGGEIVGPEKVSMGNHEGILKFTYAQPIKVTEQKHGEQFRLSRFYFQEKKIEVMKADFFTRQRIFLIKCKISEETPWYEPMKGFVKIGERDVGECWLYPKNLSGALVELDAPEEVLEGEIVTVVKKKGKNAKVYLTGQVKYINEDSFVDEGKERVKVDYNRDY